MVARRPTNTCARRLTRFWPPFRNGFRHRRHWPYLAAPPPGRQLAELSHVNVGHRSDVKRKQLRDRQATHHGKGLSARQLTVRLRRQFLTPVASKIPI